MVLLLADIDDHEALVHVDLARGQADTGRLVHGLEHVVEQGLERRRRDLGGIDRRGLGAQARIGEFEDREQGHGVEMVASVTTASGRGIVAPSGLPWAALCGL